MEYRRKCKTCKYSCCGESNPCSDICDDCQSDPDTGWGGFTDHSYIDENGSPVHFNSEQEAKAFYKCWRDIC